jgi:hypothetical protein
MEDITEEFVNALGNSIKEVNHKLGIGIFPECTKSGVIDIFMIDKKFDDINHEDCSVTVYLHTVNVDLDNSSISAYNRHNKTGTLITHGLDDEDGFDEIMDIVSSMAKEELESRITRSSR